jgi:monofunctional biosynthetic peptidoglycan transglycosylase
LFGVEAAAQKYFHVSAKNLTRRQAAMIIACLPNPKKFSVSPPDKFIQWKTEWILNQMNNIQDDDDIQELIK